MHLHSCLGASSQKNEMQEESVLDGLDLQLKKHMCTVDEIEDDKGILWMLFDIRHKQLFTVNDLWKCQLTLGEGKAISKNLCDVVSKALKASPVEALRDFQRRQFRTPLTLLSTHYNRILHRLRKNNITITQLTQLEQEHASIEARGK